MAIQLSLALLRGAPRERQVLGAAILFPALAAVATIALGMCGVLRGSAFGHALIGLLLLGIVASNSLGLWRSPPVVAERSGEHSSERRLLIAGIALVVTLALVYAANAVLFGTAFTRDDLSYHAVLAGEWVSTGRLSLGAGNYQAYYPASSETLSAWLMLPFHDDRYASLGVLVWATLAASAVYALARAQGATPARALALVALLLVAGPMLRRVRTFGATDLAGAASALAACALLIPGVGKRITWGEALLAGLAAGLAAGSKATYLPVACLLALWPLTEARTRGFRASAGLVGLVAVGALLTGGYWYLRNAALTGNPLYPFAMGPLAGPFGAADQAPTKLISHLTGHVAGSDPSVLWGLLNDWPLPLGLLSVAGLASAMRRGHPAVLLAAMAGVVLIAFPLAPFSGTPEGEGGALQAVCRYLLFPFAAGVALCAWPWREGSASSRLTAGLLGLAVLTLAFVAWGEGARMAIALLAMLVVVGLPIAILAVRGPYDRRLSTFACLAALLAVCAALALWAPHKRARTDAEFARAVARADIGHPGRSYAGAIEFLETLPAGSRIGWLSPMPQFHYWLYGRRLQLRPLALDADGRALPPLHQRQADAPWWETSGLLLGAPREPEAVAAHIVESGADYLVATSFGGDTMPAQVEPLAGSKPLDEVFRDDCTVVWRVRRD